MMSEEKPVCFGWVNASRKKLDLFKIKKTGDCKTCKILDQCTREYNQREYDQWQYTEPDEEDHEEEGFNEDEEIEENENPNEEARAIALARECLDPGYKEEEPNGNDDL